MELVKGNRQITIYKKERTNMMKEFDDKEFCKIIEDLRKYDINYKNLQERSIELSDTLLEKLSR